MEEATIEAVLSTPDIEELDVDFIKFMKVWEYLGIDHSITRTVNLNNRISNDYLD